MFVQRRNENLISKAAQTNAIVSNLFPAHFRDRLMVIKEEEQEQVDLRKKGKRNNLKSFLSTSHDATGIPVSAQKPMADLYLDTTVLFADISGFTAWSSVREPSQVFMLLETLYQAFDVIAKRRKVFKVETVGDCYVGKYTFFLFCFGVGVLHKPNSRLLSDQNNSRMRFARTTR